MGLNIWITTQDLEQHPTWDDTRFGGDREMAQDLFNLEVQTWTPPGFPYEDDLMLHRPKDFAAFRALGAKNTFPERWQQAADILEGDPKWWLYFSV